MWKLKKHKKEKTMEIYEVKGVSEASQIKKVYEEAVKGNLQYYRAVSKTNQIYGWDEQSNKFVKAQVGQEYFENPHYVAPVVEETIEEPIEEVEPIVEEMVEVADVMVEEVKVEEVKENLTTEEIDYKALYEQAQVSIKELLDENGKLKEELEKKDNQIDDLQEELDDIQEAGQIIARLFR